MLAPPELAFDYLRAEQTKQLENRLKAGELWASPWNLVFTDEVGRHYRTSTSYNHFKRIAAKIGRPSARPHDLRHIAATVAIASGADKNCTGYAGACNSRVHYGHVRARIGK